MKYEIDENNYLTGNWASIGSFTHCIDIEKLEEINLNLQWNGERLIEGDNPKIKIKTLSLLRERREKECFPIINRGQLWYARLSEEQIVELKEWYQHWLDITDTFEKNSKIEEIIPAKPKWLS